MNSSMRRDTVRRPPEDASGRPILVGRMILLGRIGAGGMGVVHAAYDPELDRKVAVKMIHPDRIASAEARARLIREAQALARLSHPNVVSVHDVGTHEEHVWVAMEFVQGVNVREWLAERPRGWREVLAVFKQAVRGIEAAHRAGLLHRDLKPDNIMLGDDGRVRVMDFGLARVAPVNDAAESADARTPPRPRELTLTGPLVGTPAYMAPEQFLGFETDARSDQFSLCVALWEALHGERPFADGSFASRAPAVLAGEYAATRKNTRVPGWLSRVVERGLSPRREQRYSDMTRLLAALEADPTRRRWALAFGAAAMVAAGGGFGMQQIAREQALAACSQAAAVIDESWDEDARIALRDGISRTGVSFAATTLERVEALLDAYADEWRATKAEVCRATTVDAEWDAELGTRADECLDERRVGFAALAEILSAPGDGDEARGIIERGIRASAELPRLAPCRDPARLRALSRRPRGEDAERWTRDIHHMLARIDALTAVGHYSVGMRLAEDAVEAAAAIDSRLLHAAATYRRGVLLEKMASYGPAEEALKSAYLDAGAAGDDEIFTAAAAALAHLTGVRHKRLDDGLLWARTAEMLLDRQGVPDDDLRRAAVLEKRSLVHNARGEHQESVDLYLRASEIREKVQGPTHPAFAYTIDHLGIAHRSKGDYESAQKLHERALMIRVDALGFDHPVTSESYHNLGGVYFLQGDLGRAISNFEKSLWIKERTLGSEHLNVAASLFNLGAVYLDSGDHAAARRSFERTLAIEEKLLGPENPDIAYPLGGLGAVELKQGNHRPALDMFQRSLFIRVESLGPEHPLVADSLHNVGAVYEAMAAYEQAIEAYEQALSITRKTLGPEHPDVADTLHNIGMLFHREAKYERARDSFISALRIREAALGDAHPDVAHTLNNLGAAARELKDYDGAFDYHRQALAIREKAHGSVHSDVALSLRNLGQLHTDLGDHAAAAASFERELAVRERLDDPLALARAEFALARELWHSTAQRARAHELAARAEVELAGLGDAASGDLSELRTWMKRRDNPR